MRKILTLLFLCLSYPAMAADNYAATAGSGLTFGAKDVGGVLYSRFLSCDPTTPTQCLAVDASGRLSIIPNTAMNVAQINGVTVLMGNGVTGTGSQRVTIASDNTAFSVNAIQSGTWNVTNISGTVSLPTGASTSALQTTGNTSLSSIDGKTPALGQALAAASVPVILPSATITTLTPPAAITGFATSANQTTANSSLATIATNSASANPINLNTVVTAQTGLTPGASATAQTGTIVAANQDISSVAGVALGVPANFGTAPAAVRSQSANAFNFVTDQVGGAAAALVGDPCQTTAKTTVPFTLATATVKVAVTGVAAKKIYVCQINLNNNAADTVAVFEATTASVCATSPIAVVGAGTTVATAGTGYNFGATGGISLGNGASQVLQTATNANDLCIAQSVATQLSGSITYVTR